MATTYKNLINANGTIYNASTGKGYATPQELAADLGIRPDQIQWANIKTGPVPTQQTSYQNLQNQGGTIVNTQTGQAYSTPEQLARDLGVQSNQIQWQNIPTQQTQGTSDTTRRQAILDAFSRVSGGITPESGQAGFSGNYFDITTEQGLLDFLRRKAAAGGYDAASMENAAQAKLAGLARQNAPEQPTTPQTQTTGNPT